MPGPVPKRVEERRRRNKVPGETTVRVVGAVRVPGLPKGTHTIARRWYRALQDSGQSQFFEPSDWAAALYVAEAMTRQLNNSRFSAQAFQVIWSAMDGLLTTESARRRARMFIQRAIEDENDPNAPTALDEYRKALGG